MATRYRSRRARVRRRSKLLGLRRALSGHADAENDRLIAKFTRRETPKQRKARIGRIKLSNARVMTLRKALGM